MLMVPYLPCMPPAKHREEEATLGAKRSIISEQRLSYGFIYLHVCAVCRLLLDAVVRSFSTNYLIRFVYHVLNTHHTFQQQQQKQQPLAGTGSTAQIPRTMQWTYHRPSEEGPNLSLRLSPLLVRSRGWCCNPIFNRAGCWWVLLDDDDLRAARCSLKFYIVITLIRHEENQFRGNVIYFSNYFIIGSCFLPVREMRCEICLGGIFGACLINEILYACSS